MGVAYLDCFSGISGNMALGALIDLGFPEEALRRALAGLPVGRYRLQVSRCRRGGLEGVLVEVEVEEAEQPHRRYADVRRMLSEAALPEGARGLALEIFRIIAEAEAKVHGVGIDEVAFHEVGAVDSIVDIVGVALGVDFLGIEGAYVSALPLGGGFVRSAHGLLPVPAPATVEILKGMRVRTDPVEEELVTPTGAAVAKALELPGEPPPTLRLGKVGYGAGSRHLERPNLLRIFLGERVEGYEEDEVEILACQVDDMQPELFPHVAERLLEGGAVDLYATPVQMKKGRQGLLLQVLADPADRAGLLEILFSETTTLGVRVSRTRRVKQGRRRGEVETRWGRVAVKFVEGLPGRTLEVRPEYEACREIALREGVPLRKVYDEVIRAGLSLREGDAATEKDREEGEEEGRR